MFQIIPKNNETDLIEFWNLVFVLSKFSNSQPDSSKEQNYLKLFSQFLIIGLLYFRLSERYFLPL